jgi:hypothetical protein
MHPPDATLAGYPCKRRNCAAGEDCLYLHPKNPKELDFGSSSAA